MNKGAGERVTRNSVAWEPELQPTHFRVSRKAPEPEKAMPDPAPGEQPRRDEDGKKVELF